MILFGLNYEIFMAYIDDIIIFSKKIKETNKFEGSFLEVGQENKVSLNPL